MGRPYTFMKLVSIVTPSYNQAPFLEQTIRSVLEQDYPRIEYMVVDGGSTDGSVDIIKKYAKILESDSELSVQNQASALQNHSIDWWISEKDNGQGEAINKGLSRAKGEIIAWLNSDDYYLPNAASSAVKVFEQNPDAVLLYGDMLAVDENRQTINVLKYKQLSLEDLLRFQIIGQPAVFMRRDAYERAGGLDTTFHFMLDHHLWIRIAQQGKILHVPQVWAAARYHAQAKNRRVPVEFGREAFRILDWMKMQPDLAESLTRVERAARASAYRVNARYFLDAGQSLSSLRAWFMAFFIHPSTALQRLNIFVSALLNLLGLGRLRGVILSRRQRAYSRDKQNL
jgi:glycosyltransferase involved in cell wall biosynthesis